MMEKELRIIISGGGTGGHIYPALAIINKIKDVNKLIPLEIELSQTLTVDNTYLPNKIRINHLQYDKIITSQNNKPYVNTQLNAQGTVNLISDNLIGFNDFKVKTQTPTDAKILT